MGTRVETKHNPKLIANILPWTKLPPFRRQYTQTHFREWKYLYIDFKISLKFVPNGSIDNNPAALI